MIQFGRDICSSLDASLEREWLETNGLGGFASSTIACVNTRRYHGLLTAALHPPTGRHVLLSKMEETVVINGSRFELSANLYPGATYPTGFEYLTAFRLDPFPIFTWSVNGIEIEKRIFMRHGENTTVLEYCVRGPAQLELRPLIAFRDYHATTHANVSLNDEVRQSAGLVSIEPYAGLPRLYFAHDALSVAPTGDWYRDFEYPREHERGLDFQEDLFQPFVMKFEGGARVIASLHEHAASDAEWLRSAEISRRAALRSPAADSFIAKRAASLHTIVAGYHWFTDWGRDTMISLPGLTLSTGRFDIARDILLAFSNAADQGMLPNRFPDSGVTPEYNTVDASLWFFEAIRQYVEATGDQQFVTEKLFLSMRSIIDWHISGTRYNIHCDSDGLLMAGDSTTQLTWMDAKVGDVAATPRNGKPVEIQALWYNALCVMGETGRAEQAKTSFNRAFWNSDAECLYDCIGGASGNDLDASIRPNQVIALSLGNPIVTDRNQAKKILEVVARDLLTPYGLRTLSPKDPAYKPSCTGDQRQRDFSYHQGTIWPWLLGPYINACVRFDVPCPSLEALTEHLNTAGLGTISEIFDGDPPHAPRGCIAQAWSVAELLRVTRRDADAPCAFPPLPPVRS